MEDLYAAATRVSTPGLWKSLIKISQKHVSQLLPRKRERASMFLFYSLSLSLLFYKIKYLIVIRSIIFLDYKRGLW